MEGKTASLDLFVVAWLEWLADHPGETSLDKLVDGLQGVSLPSPGLMFEARQSLLSFLYRQVIVDLRIGSIWHPSVHDILWGIDSCCHPST